MEAHDNETLRSSDQNTEYTTTSSRLSPRSSLPKTPPKTPSDAPRTPEVHMKPNRAALKPLGEEVDETLTEAVTPLHMTPSRGNKRGSIGGNNNNNRYLRNSIENDESFRDFCKTIA